MSPKTQLRKKLSCESFWLCEDLDEKEPHRFFTRSVIYNLAKLVDKMSWHEHGNCAAGYRGNYPKPFYNHRDELPKVKWPVMYREFPIFHSDYPRWDMDERGRCPGPTRIQVPWGKPENSLVSYHSPRGELSYDNYRNVVKAKYFSKREYDRDEFKALFEKYDYEDTLGRERARKRKARRKKAKGKEAQRSRARRRKARR
ncbi:hypothetical protein N7528_005424 [Penicillium herquei]|nr:hypothetical protein N7528_005424 [Penicillium herquei]